MVPRATTSFSSGLLERRARRLQRLRQQRAVEYHQRRSRSTFPLTADMSPSAMHCKETASALLVFTCEYFTYRTKAYRTRPAAPSILAEIGTVRYRAIKCCLHTSLLPYCTMPYCTRAVATRFEVVRFDNTQCIIDVC